MIKYLISILGVSALLLLNGCTSVFEPPQPQPAPQPRVQAVSKPPQAVSKPAVIQRPADTGVGWVTDISDLKSRHRFQLAQHLVEVDNATHYYGGSVTDIEVGARLRAVGVYRDEVVVADTVYIERLARPRPAKATTGSKEPGAKADQPRVSRTSQPTERSASPPKGPDADKVERTATQPVAAKHDATRPRAEKAVSAPAAKSRPLAVKKEQVKATESSKKTPPATSAKTGESQLAKAEPSIRPTVPEKEAVKPTEPTPPAPPTKDFSHLVFDDRILPMALDHGWRLDRQRDVVDGAPRCMLLSPAVTIFDGYYPAKVWLRINPVRAWVKTDSNIDNSYPGQGLRVDGGALAPFAKKLLDEQTTYTDASVLHGMAEGRTLTVALGFWPTWPKTKTQTARLDLAGFANAHAALQACSQQQQAARK
ncbi:hypothetical protein [Nitrococcus mobilis]|uniref:Uncharacterized protein n=1 Tax=Nitrococcus mobilis Nb-231 TaxID=314278 RepID=A4BTK1_9GAMM|nr:hypothetical protein [Nitrococcus mobilis]EAR20957.1 hypothetical protein NB231_00190 [Nitrococcus mobilis Nb-231]